MALAVGLAVLIGAVLGSQLLWLGHPRRWGKRVALPVLPVARSAWGSAQERVRSLRPRDRGDPRPGQWALLGAIGIGFVLRLAWAIWATRTPTGFADPAAYLRVASDFGHGVLPRFDGGDPSAYWPPGYPAVLAPFVAFADRTGWISPAFAASLLNVVAGTITIALSGWLARRWFGPRAGNPAAWLVALCPALIYWTSTAHSETVFTPMLLGIIVLSTLAVDRSTPSTRLWMLTGLLVGLAILVRSPGLIGLTVPALAVRGVTGSWRGAGRASGIVLLGALALLVPWTVRNGVQVGVWTPTSTNNAAAACFGHHDDALGLWEPEKLTDRQQVDCYRHSPFDDKRLRPIYEGMGQTVPIELGEPDEPRWYRASMSKAVRWAVTHPVDEVGLSAAKLWAIWGSEGRVVDGARSYEDAGWAGAWHETLGALANLWLWVVGLLAALALARVPAARRALPIWVPIGLYTLAIVGGVAEPHYRYPVAPLVAILAAAFLTRCGQGSGDAAGQAQRYVSSKAMM